MELEDLEAIIDKKYYGEERDEEQDPDGPYLIAFALLQVVKELRALRALLTQEQDPGRQTDDIGDTQDV
ncbi:hypothetical protein [Ktedonobacter racemifer]|uniref:Uncharacterized protein n=1 Tax=Ktedonobacter racemifer DSM 44963 TaxID=485913 RepID=D6U8P9_KTERA|nr:hypothetical protein [Ktedonobacter racemifer]EFH79609.1 hypothetical protein Krac_0087 [Ktedonobacter racemifer DSM 44963]